MLARPGSCCYPLPGDEVVGFITRGRGVVIHRADCPNLRHLLEREPERQIAVDWPAADKADKAEGGGARVLRANIIVEGSDRTGLLRDVTGVITNSKINMVKVQTMTRERPHAATIDAILEISKPEQLEEILKELRAVPGVVLAERKLPGKRAVASAAEGADGGRGAVGKRPRGA
jgi:(p)ppGpp synthase/HD superfamily hydrolase